MRTAGTNRYKLDQQLGILIFNNKKGEIRVILKRKSYSDSIWNRSEHMRLLHQQGRYAGTSKIGVWNSSQEKHDRMIRIREQNLLDKTSRGYGSEYAMRINNRNLLHNKFQGSEGFMYFLEFPGSIKVGFSKDWERRVEKQIPKMILGGKVIAIISGPTNDLADLEFDTMIKFQEYTKLDPTKTRYTEFLEKSQKSNVYKFLREEVKKNSKLKFEIEN